MSVDSPRYSLPHRVIHWIMAVAILIAIPGGVIMGKLPPGQMQNNVYDLHKSLGVLVLILALVRIVLKRRNGVPSPATPIQSLCMSRTSYSTRIQVCVRPSIGAPMKPRTSSFLPPSMGLILTL